MMNKFQTGDIVIKGRIVLIVLSNSVYWDSKEPMQTCLWYDGIIERIYMDYVAKIL